jgi:hypothetical protein
VFALALRLGMTVRDLLERLDSDELTEWAAFLDLEREASGAPAQPAPAGDVETDLRRILGRPNGNAR